MKKLLTLFITISLVLLCSNVFAATQNKISKTGIIQYKISGENSGLETLYFKNYGKIQARYITATGTKANAGKKVNSLILITNNGEWIYSVDLNKKVGIKFKNPMFAKSKTKSSDDISVAATKLLKSLGSKKVGTKKVAGQTCDIWQAKSGKSQTCIWNGIPIKTTAGTGSKRITIVATSIQTNATVPEAKFKIPSDITIKTIKR